MADRIPKVSKDEVLNQIRAAAHDAFLEVLCGEGDNPGLAAVTDGVREAVKALAREREAMTRRQDAAAESGPEPGAPAAEEGSKP